MASWNVQGIKTRTHSKLEDNDFIATISGHHIIGLIETHTTDDDKFIPGFISVSYNKKNTGTKKSGGIIILIKKDIKEGVSCYNTSFSEITWIKLKREFFRLDKDIFIAFVYACPQNSSNASKLDTDVFKRIQDYIY